MRERLAGAFVLLALAVLILAGSVRAWSVLDLMRDQEVMQLTRQADLVAGVLDDRRRGAGVVGEAELDALLAPGTRLEYVGAAGRATTVTDPDFDAGGDLITAEADAGSATVRLSASESDVSDVYTREISAMVTLLLLVLLLAGLAGWWLANRLAAPFRELADAAAALGRGRFDVRVPDTPVPEAQAIGRALQVSAGQLEGRLSRERDFAEHASHQLRTPLTSLRLELEDLALREDVPEDVREAALRCVTQVEAAGGAADELVSLTRSGALVEGGQVPLRDLAVHVTQVWSDRLTRARRTVSAGAEGDLELLVTPGPMEHVLDLVLDDVVSGAGAVRLQFHGSDSHLRVVVPSGVAGRGPHRGLAKARTLVQTQGGRMTGDLADEGVEILLPIR